MKPPSTSVFRLNNEFSGPYATSNFFKKSVDSRPTRSTRKWSRTAHPAPRNFPGPAQPKLLYKSSDPDTASAQR
jgi:hypothetical protein